MSEDPYQVPLAEPLEEPSTVSPRVIRASHLRQEGLIKSVSTLYFLGTLGAVGTIFTGITEPWLLVAAATFAVVLTTTAIGIRRLRPWVRIPGILVSALCLAISLLTFAPLGVLIHIFSIATLAGKKSATIFTPEYAAIMAATPDMKYKTSRMTWIIIGIIALVFLGFSTWALYFAPTLE